MGSTNRKRSSYFGTTTVMLLAAILGLTGCVSNKYQHAEKNTPPPQTMNAAFAPARFDATLATVITYNGPGSWKRDAIWDEYVITVSNPGSQPLTIVDERLTDIDGTVRQAGIEPWALQKQSKTLERKYKDAGIAFVRYTAPAVVIVGTGAAVIAGAGVMSATAGVAAALTVVALPVYYIGALIVNHSSKVAMEKEFTRRRLALPLTLAPGETRTGSLFFPMVPSPRSLALDWSDETGQGQAVLSLDFLRGLHIKTADSLATE